MFVKHSCRILLLVLALNAIYFSASAKADLITITQVVDIPDLSMRDIFVPENINVDQLMGDTFIRPDEEDKWTFSVKNTSDVTWNDFHITFWSSNPPVLTGPKGLGLIFGYPVIADVFGTFDYSVLLDTANGFSATGVAPGTEIRIIVPVINTQSIAELRYHLRVQPTVCVPPSPTPERLQSAALLSEPEICPIPEPSSLALVITAFLGWMCLTKLGCARWLSRS